MVLPIKHHNRICLYLRSMHKVLLFLLLVFVVSSLLAQGKIYVLENVYASKLNPYNPAPFYEELFLSQLKVKDINKNPLSEKVNRTAQEHKKMIRRHANGNTTNAYYVALGSSLYLPIINLTRFILKVPTRISLLLFIINVYNSKAERIPSDTITNTGCIVKIHQRR
ncbi:MAG: hypothetical protein JWQ96_2093 [Segetibacter sp.]|nr:hypothetical protein [Segetibacter sp.]